MIDHDKLREAVAKAISLVLHPHKQYLRQDEVILKQANGSITATLAEIDAQGLVVVQGWQPIETAPKDGTTIDLWDEDSDKRYTDCRWHQRDGIWLCGMYGYKPEGFSHWMLPPKPEPKA